MRQTKNRHIDALFGDVNLWIKWTNTGWLFLGHLDVDFIHSDMMCDFFHDSVLLQAIDVVCRIFRAHAHLRKWRIFGTSNAQ